MYKLLILLFSLVALKAQSQISDIIVVKKPNGRSLIQLSSGNKVELFLKDGTYYNGIVHIIKNDSITIKTWRILITQNQFGGAIIDTITFYYNKHHYQEIKSIKLTQKQKFFQRNTHKILQLGSLGYVGLDLVNNLRPGQKYFTKNTIKTYAIAGAFFLAGTLIKKYLFNNGFSKKRHSINYVKIL